MPEKKRNRKSSSRWKDDVGPRVLGSGPQALVAITLAERLFRLLRSGARPEVITIDVEKLGPGETLTVATRPALSGKERKLEAGRERVQHRLERLEPSARAVRKVERKVSKAERDVAKARSPRRSRKALRELERTRRGRDVVTAPSRRARKLLIARGAIDDELASERRRVLAKSDKKRRPAITRIFRF
jgi:chromosome segregation ATPase